MQTETINTQIKDNPAPISAGAVGLASNPQPAASAAATNPADSTTAPRWASDEERLRKFGEAIDAIRTKIEAKIGEEDVHYIKRVDAFSRTMEVAGRLLLHFSFEPITWSMGVIALWLHKQLQATEVGHTALHGAFDGLPNAERYQSATFKWDVPIDEEAWRYGHNIRHHQFTNITGKDPDIHFGPIRLNDQTPHSAVNYFQIPIMAVVATNFGFGMNMHFTGMTDYWGGTGREGKFDFIKDRSWETAKDVHKKAFRKWIPYYAKNYVLFPLLAGPGFLKVLAGNALAEVMRDLYSAATIYCGHIGEDVKDYPEGTKARNRGEWYAMQVDSANNFDVPLPVSMLCGALDLQVEHHMFPKFPTNRLREAAPQVKKVCEEYGVNYKTDTWPGTLKKVMSRLWQLSFPDKKSAEAEQRLAA